MFTTGKKNLRSKNYTILETKNTKRFAWINNPRSGIGLYWGDACGCHTNALLTASEVATTDALDEKNYVYNISDI